MNAVSAKFHYRDLIENFPSFNIVNYSARISFNLACVTSQQQRNYFNFAYDMYDGM